MTDQPKTPVTPEDAAEKSIEAGVADEGAAYAKAIAKDEGDEKSD